jgi:hypothetical protein
MASLVVFISDWFWGTLLLLFVFIPLVLIWVFTLVDLFVRTDLRGWQIALRLFVIVLLPIIGVLIYYVARPDEEITDLGES